MNICIDNRDKNLFHTSNGWNLIRFPEQNGMIPMLIDYYTDMRFDYSDNNFAESEMLHRLNRDLLPTLEDIFGADNIVEFETDLTTLNGDNAYGTLKSKISIPTIGFYNSNREIFDKHNKWYWWTATPYDEVGCDLVCISSYNGNELAKPYFGSTGVRPLIMLKASAFRV